MWIFPVLLFNKNARRCISAAARSLSMSLACRRGRRAQIHTHTPQWSSTENTDITTVGTSCTFQYSCLSVSQVSSGSRVSNWPLNNKLHAVNQPITNKCHLVFSCMRSLLLFWASHCQFAVLKLPECSNSRLCSLKDHTSVYLCTTIWRLTGAFQIDKLIFLFPSRLPVVSS